MSQFDFTDAPTEANSTQQIGGTIVRLTFQNPDTGFCVVKLKPDEPVERQYYTAPGEVTLVGVLPGIGVGEEVLAQGQWEHDSQYGTRFRVKWYKPRLPTGERGIVAYLGSGAVKGVGPKTAERIVATFGDRTFDVLDQTPGRLGEVPGMGRKTQLKIAQSWRLARGDRELVTFLGEHGLPPSLAARLHKTYGDAALSVVRANPYQLISDVRGIGFARADAVARRIGIAPDAPERIDAALVHLLERQSEEGHTYLPRERLEELAAELVQTPHERIAARVEDGLSAGRITGAEVGGRPAIFINALHDAERAVVERLARLARARRRLPAIDAVETLADFEQRTRFRLAPAQRQAALELAREGLLILTGGPGTGKTTTVRAVIELFQRGRREIKLAAPTGRAARRLSETAKLPAETIHRLLGYQPPLGRFGRNAANPVEADLVIVDEVSMLDVPLAAALLDAIAPGTCLLLVGDEDQLPSVGPGNVLADLIAAKALPVARLTEIFRQAGQSLIVSNAHRINRGLMPWLEPPEGEVKADFFFIERERPEQVLEAIRTLVGERIPRKFGLDPRTEIQVLSPMRRGELGVNAINVMLKELLNPAGAGATTFAAGDRVMQMSNNYDKAVYNGDIGMVEGALGESGELIVRFEGKPIAYMADELDQLVLAYATTIHKSQGSEFPAVVIPIHTQHWIMLQRNLIYTALTRARRLACLVGTRRALRQAIANNERQQRFTALRQWLIEPASDASET